jgi:hypothetical protein
MLMRRQTVVRTAIVVLCALALVAPGLPAQARERDRTGEPDRQYGRPCKVRDPRPGEGGRAAVPHRPGRTGSRHRCDLKGGVLATFEVEGERFRVWVTNPTTIQQILDLQAGTSTANIPNGVVRYGPGEANHNVPWSWHLDPEQIEMADFAIEVCDGVPSYVEAHLEEFVEVVGSYCPWGAMLVSVEDLR